MKELARRFAYGLVRRAPLGFKKAIISGGERIVGRQRLHGKIPGLDHGRYRLNVPTHTSPFVLTDGLLVVTGWALDLEAGQPLRLRATIGGRVSNAIATERPDLVVAFSRFCPLPVRCGAELQIATRRGVATVTIEVETAPGTWAPIQRLIVFSTGTRRARQAVVPNWRYPEWRAAQASVADGALPIGDAGASVAVLIDASGPGDLTATIAALDAQSRRTSAVTIFGHEPGGLDFRSALQATVEDFVLPLRAGDRLDPDALARLVRAAQAEPRPDLVYADEDSDGDGEPAPFFKPDWSPDTLEAFDYIGAPALYRGELARTLAAEGAYDLALRLTELSQKVVHLEAVLCRRALPATRAIDAAADMRALAGRLARTGRKGQITPLGPDLPGYDCKVEVAGEPLVSIVMPTAGREKQIDGRHIDLVVNCVESIRARSTYRKLEFIIVKNDDMPAAKEARLVALGCKVVLFDEPVFNVAKKLNLGTQFATGEFIILMNDDIEIVAPDWIERLLAQAQKPHVGLVGAKLVYPHGDIQHAGVVLVDGNPDHVRHHFPGADLGCFFSTAAPRNYLAVTGACMLGRAEIVRQVGGYTEALAVSFNDVDFCLKIRELGLTIVYEPGCELVHFESASRTLDLDAAELRLFYERWIQRPFRDPYYNTTGFSLTPPVYEPFMDVAIP